ncbi:hypothetical protein V8C86DRAFT_2475175 [Haematococcus lacustris]
MQSLAVRSPVAHLWRAYESALQHRPLAVQSCTAGVLWGAGDLLAQKLTQGSGGKRSAAKPLDWRHSALTGVFGAAVIGPLGTAWYSWLEAAAAAAFGHLGAVPVLTAKVAADATAWNAFNIASYFLWNELLLERGNVSTWGTKMMQEFAPTFLAEAIAWPPIMAVIFARLPVSHHLLAVNLVTVLDVAFLAAVSAGTLNLDPQAWAAKLGTQEQPLGPNTLPPSQQAHISGSQLPGKAQADRCNTCNRYPPRPGSKSSKPEPAAKPAAQQQTDKLPDLWGVDCMHAGDAILDSSSSMFAGSWLPGLSQLTKQPGLLATNQHPVPALAWLHGCACTGSSSSSGHAGASTGQQLSR